jgi:hypothetical protein
LAEGANKAGVKVMPGYAGGSYPLAGYDGSKFKNTYLGAGKASGSFQNLPGGSYRVWARYGGDTTNASSSSTPSIHVTITPEASTTTLAIKAYNSVTEQPIPATSIPYVSYVFADADITWTAEGSKTQGVVTGKVNFADGANTLGSAVVVSRNGASWPVPPASLSWPTPGANIPVLSRHRRRNWKDLPLRRQ